MNTKNLQDNLNIFYEEVVLNQNGNYPSLSKLFNKRNQNRYKFFANLYLYMNEFGFSDGQEPSYDRYRGEEVYASRDKLVELYGGSKKTWERYLYEFITLGLICVSIPRMTAAGQKYNTPTKQRSADRANKQGRNAVWYYSVPLYTSELLKIAEARAVGVERVGSGIDKDSARHIIGDELETKRTFDIGYGMHDETKARRHLIECYVLSRMLNRGYATKEGIIKFGEIVGEKESGGAYRWKKTLDSFLPELLDKFELVYSRPTREEMDFFKLPSTSKIITFRVTHTKKVVNRERR